MMAYVLLGEYGEYESHTTMVLGVFSSEELATSAIPKIKELGAKQWEAYQDRERKKKEYLQRFKPRTVYPPGSPFPDGCILYENEQYKEADEFLGPAPTLIPECDEYRVECFNLDSIEAR